MRNMVIGALLLLASVSQAQAFGVSIANFKRWSGDPQKESLVASYLAGLLEGEVTGIALEALAVTGSAGKTKSVCLNQNDTYDGTEALADVRAYLKANPKTPDDWLVGTVLAKILKERYRC